MRSARWLLALALLAPCAWTTPAHADETKDKAEALFKDGLRLMKEEKWEAARESLKEANLTYPTASGLYNLAVAEEKTHRPVEALTHLRAYVVHPKADAANVRQVKTVMWPELYKVTGHLRIKGTTSAVLLDKFVIGEGKTPEEVDVLPGEHALEAESKRVVVTVAAGEVKDVDFAQASKSPPPVVAPPAPGGTTQPFTPPPHEDAHSPSPAKWIVEGALVVGGLAGLGVGVGFAAASHSAKDTENARRVPGVCVSLSSEGCRSLDSARHDVDSRSNVSTVGYVVGGALLAGAVVTYFLWRPREKHAASQFVVSPLAGGGALFYGATF